MTTQRGTTGSRKLLITAGAQAAAQGLVKTALLTNPIAAKSALPQQSIALTKALALVPRLTAAERLTLRSRLDDLES